MTLTDPLRGGNEVLEMFLYLWFKGEQDAGVGERDQPIYRIIFNRTTSQGLLHLDEPKRWGMKIYKTSKKLALEEARRQIPGRVTAGVLQDGQSR